MSRADALRLGIADGDDVTVRSEHGELRESATIGPMAPGNLQVHWPEGNALLPRDARSAEAGIPDLNTRASVEPAGPREYPLPHELRAARRRSRPADLRPAGVGDRPLQLPLPVLHARRGAAVAGA